MKLLVVSLGARHLDARPGDTIHLRDGPAVVVARLPPVPGRPPAFRVTPEPPCGMCEAPMRWDTDAWRCRACGHVATEHAAGATALESLGDQARAGKNRRRAEARMRQVDQVFADEAIRSRAYRLLRRLSRGQIDHEAAQLAAQQLLSEAEGGDDE